MFSILLITVSFVIGGIHGRNETHLPKVQIFWLYDKSFTENDLLLKHLRQISQYEFVPQGFADLSSLKQRILANQKDPLLLWISQTWASELKREHLLSDIIMTEQTEGYIATDFIGHDHQIPFLPFYWKNQSQEPNLNQLQIYGYAWGMNSPSQELHNQLFLEILKEQRLLSEARALSMSSCLKTIEQSNLPPEKKPSFLRNYNREILNSR